MFREIGAIIDNQDHGISQFLTRGHRVRNARHVPVTSEEVCLTSQSDVTVITSGSDSSRIESSSWSQAKGGEISIGNTGRKQQHGDGVKGKRDVD